LLDPAGFAKAHERAVNGRFGKIEPPRELTRPDRLMRGDFFDDLKR
jgi:hypothetical protein